MNEPTPTAVAVFGEERRQQILTTIQSDGRARVRDLALLLGVTETTIRKDIADLDRARLVRRIHGGAIAIDAPGEPDVADRIDKNLPAKRAIARACLSLIDDGDAVFLDSGTTVAGVAEALTGSALALDGLRLPTGVNVLTNSMPVAAVLARSNSVRHTVLGGQYRPLGASFVGPLALQSLRTFTMTTAFIGATGVTELGVTVADTAEGEVKQAAMEHSHRVVVPVDSTKIGASDFVRVADLDQIDIIVTNQAGAEFERICASADIELIIAGR